MVMPNPVIHLIQKMEERSPSLPRLWLQKTGTRFLTILFVHSLFLTVAMPLNRIVHGRWMGGSNIFAIMANFMRMLGSSSCITPEKYTEGWIPNWHCIGVVTQTCKDGDGNATNYADAVFLYADEEESPGIDITFSTHIFFALLWVLVGYLQMVPIRTHSIKVHRLFGYIAIAVHLTYIVTTLNILFFDEANNPLAYRYALRHAFMVSCALLIHKCL